MRKRNRRFSLWLNDKEFNYLAKQAANAGLKKEPFVRKLIMGIEIYPRPPDEVREIISAINRVGNNINQIARKVNITDTVSSMELKEVKEQLLNLIMEIRR